MDKLRRGFLWKGSEDAQGGHCLVRWGKVKRPNRLGGLGVLDLELFSRALRLRWLWFQWTDPDRPWVGSDVPCSEVDKQLFRVSTRVTVGNGCQAKFWESSWLEGKALRDIAPNLYKLAWRKNRLVWEELQNDNWMRGLWKMNSTDEMAELVNLWSLLQNVQLTNQDDQLHWRWTANGVYSAKSAYEAQFKGSYCDYNSMAIWKAKVEGKHRFFAWLLVQSKLLTADKLQARNWPCEPKCVLCDQAEETAEHLCLHCVYAQEVWVLVARWTEDLVSVPATGIGLQQWWNSSMQGHSKEHRRRLSSILIYTTWNIWKERNRRIFEHVISTPAAVLVLIKEEMKLRMAACEGVLAS